MIETAVQILVVVILGSFSAIMLAFVGLILKACIENLVGN
jgi:hypothetical protein